MYAPGTRRHIKAALKLGATMEEITEVLVQGVQSCNMLLALGMTLTIREIVAPLRDWSLVAKALLANFVVVPITAYLLVQATHLERGLAIGLILVATAADDAFLLKLSEVAKANMAFTLGLVVLLNVASIIYMPIVVPLCSLESAWIL
jgi:predicted Na+-dependent transporter